MDIVLIVALILLGWLLGGLINHLGNVLPLQETPFQQPFCKRTLDKDHPEFLSTVHKDEESQPERLYCHAPKPPVQWSGLLAYLTGNQHCATCGQALGWRTVAVELITPVLLVVLYLQFSLSVYLAFLIAYTAILVLLTVTDLEHRLIQHVVIVPALLIALGGAFVTSRFTWQQALFGGVVGLVVFYILAWISRGGLGGGDVTLSTFMGLIVAFPNVVMYILWGIFFAGLGAVLLLLSRRATLKTYFPYGPFLIVTGWVVLVWGEGLYTWFWG